LSGEGRNKQKAPPTVSTIDTLFLFLCSGPPRYSNLSLLGWPWGSRSGSARAASISTAVPAAVSASVKTVVRCVCMSPGPVVQAHQPASQSASPPARQPSGSIASPEPSSQRRKRNTGAPPARLPMPCSAAAGDAAKIARRMWWLERLNWLRVDIIDLYVSFLFRVTVIWSGGARAGRLNALYLHT